MTEMNPSQSEDKSYARLAEQQIDSFKVLKPVNSTPEQSPIYFLKKESDEPS